MNDEHLIPLLERYAAGRDPALRDELFERYLPLARAVARKFSGRGVETEVNTNEIHLEMTFCLPYLTNTIYHDLECGLGPTIMDRYHRSIDREDRFALCVWEGRSSVESTRERWTSRRCRARRTRCGRTSICCIMTRKWGWKTRWMRR